MVNPPALLYSIVQSHCGNRRDLQVQTLTVMNFPVLLFAFQPRGSAIETAEVKLPTIDFHLVMSTCLMQHQRMLPDRPKVDRALDIEFQGVHSSGLGTDG